MAADSASPGSTHRVTDRFAKTAHEVVDRAAERSGWAEERLRKTGDHYGEQSRQAIETMTGYIHEHPYTSLCLALAGGFVIGTLLRRR